jgi:hypothetical protein
MNFLPGSFLRRGSTAPVPAPVTTLNPSEFRFAGESGEFGVRTGDGDIGKSLIIDISGAPDKLRTCDLCLRTAKIRLPMMTASLRGKLFANREITRSVSKRRFFDLYAMFPASDAYSVGASSSPYDR